MNSIYVISIKPNSIFNYASTIIGFIENKDENIINKYLKKEYNITLGVIVSQKSRLPDGYRWEYYTSNKELNVIIEYIYNINTIIQ